MNQILTLITFFGAGMLFLYLKGKITNKFKTTTYETVLDKETRKELADLYKKGVITVKEYKKKLGKYAEKVFGKPSGETFQWIKFKKMFYLGNGVEWIKSIKEIIDLRKLVIYSVIIGIIFAYGWYQGTQGKPVKIDIGHGKEAYIKLNSHFLHIQKDGTVYVEDKSGAKIKQISVKDIPSLRKKLAPIGFELKPVAIIGYGYGGGEPGGEAGIGLSFLRYWRGRIEAFATNKGGYIGTSYKLNQLKLHNSYIGVGYGRSWKDFLNDDRVIIYFKVEF